ncbi:MAG: S9 family peptidase [Acidobacteria bacterium]|nr:S9 family peptidase [Acidobacteriota bacterium]
MELDRLCPVPKKIPRETRIHGYTLTDDYCWLRDKTSAEVVAHLESERAYTESVMAPTRALQETLYAEMLGRIQQTDLSVPARSGGYWYYSRTEEGKQYPVLCRRHGSMDAAEQVLLDLNALAEGHQFLSLGAYAVSDDGNWLAFSLDTTGYRQYTLRVKDLRTGQLSVEQIERTGSVVWAADHRTIFYTTEDAVSKRSDRCWRHLVGSVESALVFEEPDELYDVAAGKSLDKEIIFLGSYAKTSREIRYLPASQPTGEFEIIVPRSPGHEYDVDHYQGQFYITTNRGAKNFQVVTAPMTDPAEANWNIFIPHNPLVKIEALSFFKDHLVVSEREAGLTHLRIIQMSSKRSHRVAADEPDYTMSLAANPEFETRTIRFAYQSMVTPSSVYEYDMNSGDRTLLKRQPVLGGYEPDAFEAQRIWAPARDGRQVPISLVYQKDTPLDGTAPLLLYAYGSYGISMAPSFSSARLSLLERGVIFAVAYIRGGGELGEEWREAGRMMQKMNTFHDFIDCAEYLVEHRFTSTDRLVIQGGSAGGLLVGAVSNMCPDLFKAAVAQVPFVDIMNTMLDATLPLTTAEYLEWGNPNEKPAFDYMLQYSPYDNIRAQRYPAMLVHVSLNDSQVPYWEGAKFVAKLRDLKTDDNPVLLKANLGAGHGGASGRYDAMRETAFTYAFVLWQVQKELPVPTGAAMGTGS